jgi:GNAT superfamily N-acetyltransferase
LIEFPEIQFAQPADGPAIAALTNAAFRPERFFIDGDRTSREKVAALFNKGKFFLIREADRVVACVYVELRGDRGYFGLLAVTPERQRSGLGGRLIATAEDYCRAHGCRVMDLTLVNLREQLPVYYRRHGYTESGRLPFPADQNPKMPVHLIRMSKAL